MYLFEALKNLSMFHKDLILWLKNAGVIYYGVPSFLNLLLIVY